MDLTAEQIDAWERDGFLAIPGAIPIDRCAELRTRAQAIVDAFDPTTVSIFSTQLSPLPALSSLSLLLLLAHPAPASTSAATPATAVTFVSRRNVPP